MQFNFFTTSGTGLFSRNDIEEGHWTQEEYQVNATFPYNKDKVIEKGQRIGFTDPATESFQVFEIRKVTNIEPDHYQQIVAEHIVISELSDEHIDSAEITDKTAAQALTTALSGTLWSVGTSAISNVSSCDFSRGSVWQTISTIQSNWNCYIVPRITVSASGTIGTRKLDIIASGGSYNGIRLSIEKNISDSSVNYDDSEVYTALYGYGGSVQVQHAGQDDTTEELTFKDVVWTATSSHPAKPSGQKYLEWAEKTAIYGRNGRPRYGYYQNGDIKNATTLLEKTWEALKLAAEPKISISGTVSDLYRLGYNDQPLTLHELAIIEIAETGEVFQKEIIRLDVDLVDPTANRVEIGDYVPNIIYINRETNEKATGGGGGGRHGQTNQEDEDSKYYTEYIRTNEMIGMVIGKKEGGYYIKGGQIILSINEDDGVTALIQADVIDIQGVVTALEAYDISCGGLTSGSISCTDLTSSGAVAGSAGYFDDLWIGSESSGQFVEWETYTARYVGVSDNHYYLYSSGSSSTTPSGGIWGKLITNTYDTTLHFLGYTSTSS